MAVFNEPTKWAQSLGATANADVIPDEAGAMDVDISKIFPAVFSVPLSQGGKAIPRRTLNGILKLLGDWLYYYQQGGVASYSNTVDYVVGRVVLYNGGLYKCIQDNVHPSPHNPTDKDYWSLLLTADDIANIYATVKLDNVSTDSIFNLQNCDLSEQEITETLHNNIFRGHDLLHYFTDLDALQNAVSSGDFSKIYIGDYVEKTFTYGGTQYTTKFRVAGINSYYNYGDTALTQYHLVMVPDNTITEQMNTSDTTSGGYVGSRMYNTVLPALLAALAGTAGTPFYGHVISHRELFVNTVSNGVSTNWTWYDNSICLMSEQEIYGHAAWGSSGYDRGYANAQLPLFKLAPQYIATFNRTWHWLRSVYSDTTFCDARNHGNANPTRASYAGGVRPRFLFG